MVFSFGSGRMATMARILVTGSLSQATAEEYGHQKFASQYIQRELREADEDNLLDEEDMHVFGLKPMGDPLHLVCCNACKKPVKTSQYAAHSELCRLLNSTETISELDGGAGHKKHSRKEKKTANAKQADTVDKQRKLEPRDAADTALTGSCLDEQVGLASSFLISTKGTSICMNTPHIMDDGGVSPVSGGCFAGLMLPPVKRSKLVASECLPLSDDLEAAGSESQKDLNAEIRPYDDVVGHQKPTLVCERGLPIEDKPGPLATKMYYSQRNHRFRSALTHLFYEGMAKEHCSESVCSKGFQTLPLETSSPDIFSQDQMDEQSEKKDAHSLPLVQNPDQLILPSYEICMGEAGGSPSAKNLPNQFPVNNVLMPHTASVDMIRSKYLPKPYSFVGPPLITMQQPNGSVPVT